MSRWGLVVAKSIHTRCTSRRVASFGAAGARRVEACHRDGSLEILSPSKHGAQRAMA
eukprot:CAMPEP_0177157188 /NCGR_PEP_ID=MMETSP0367-20130122/3119_1 /TAXON_ID=447022 ORGANISM="Scrippsiella hangoei-like, Strain SHHI-4" /NCGR_SAMPLE_ID=MMETSP0367 /ASSEMBLY_ACC=CAM_ASM_000362 /LENGTH=56 /DNA_ID=CAMNT_0018602677 /DNA_START=77 /DNA_END=247 /DNA_ORIENTATION=+